MNYQYTCCKCVYTTCFSDYDLAGKTFKSCIYCGHHTPIMQDLKALPKQQSPFDSIPTVSVNTSDYQNISVAYDCPGKPPKAPTYYCCTVCKYVNPIYTGETFQYCYKCNTGQYVSDSLSELFRGDCKSCKGKTYFHFNNSETVSCVYCSWVCHIADLTVGTHPAFYISNTYCHKCVYDSKFCLHVDNPLGKWVCAVCTANKTNTSENAYTYSAPGYKNDVKSANHYYASDGTCITKYGDFLPKVHYSCNSCLALADHDYYVAGSNYVTYSCMICGAYKEFYKQGSPFVVDWSINPIKPKITKVEEKKEKTPVEKKPDSESIIAYIRDIERVYHYLNDDKFICGYSLSSSKKNNVERLSKKDQETVLKHLSSYMCVECVNVKNEAKTV